MAIDKDDIAYSIRKPKLVSICVKILWIIKMMVSHDFIGLQMGYSSKSGFFPPLNRAGVEWEQGDKFFSIIELFYCIYSIYLLNQ